MQPAVEGEAVVVQAAEVSPQRWAAGQPVLTGVTAAPPPQPQDRAGRAFGVHSLGKAGGGKAVGNEAVSVLQSSLLESAVKHSKLLVRLGSKFLSSFWLSS